MVHIKKLVLNNFKSFGGKTEIKFMDQLNIIIGPNGSGKSNVSEAISFVLGRLSTKGLRTEKLSHVVFNGGKNGKPAKNASVKIVFSNEDEVFPLEEDFVEIGRKIGSDGHSDYLINGNKTTRTEILNLLDYVGLSPDGFNIIMQGKIAEFVDMNCVERGDIIEQISGIATYEEKKKKALKELEKVKEKIKETRILLKERKKHLKELKKEKEQAEKFKNAQDELNYKKGCLLFKKLEDKKEELDNINEKQDRLKKGIEKKTEAITKAENKIKKYENEINNLNEVLGAQGAEKKKKLDKKIENVKDECNKLETNIESHKNEIKRIKDRKAQIMKNLMDYKEEIKKLGNDVEEYDDKIKKLKNELRKLRESSDNKSEINYFDLKNKITEIKEELLDKRGKKEELIKKQEAFNNLKDLKEELSHKEGLLSQVLKKLEQEMSNNSETAIKLEQAVNKINGLKRKLERLNTKRAVTIQRGGKGLKQLMQQGFKGVEGTVSQLCKVDERYELPVSVAAGSRLFNVVVKDEGVAKKCIEFLRSNKLGVTTFLPLNKIKPYSRVKGLLKINGVVDYAINLVDYDTEYSNIFKYVLGSTLIVEDINAAKKVGIGKVRMVTLKGDLISKSGAISGGYRSKKGNVFKLASKKVEEKIDDVKEEIQKMDEVYERIKKVKDENDQNIMSLREKRASLETEIKNLKMLIRNKGELSQGFNIKELKKVEERIDELSKELLKTEEDISDYEEEFNIETFEETKKVINEFEEKLNSLTVDKGIKESRLKRLKSKEVVNLEKINNDLDKQLEEFKQEIEEFKKKLKNNKEQLKLYKNEEEKFQDKLEENYEKKESLEKEVNELKLSIKEKSIRIDDAREKINNSKLLIAEIKSKIEGLEMRYAEYEELSIESVSASVKELEHEIFLLEKKLEKFGNVNLKALDVFKIVEEEFNEVNDKMALLEEENDAIVETMMNIEAKKEATFMQTFNEVHDNFQRIFSILSPGGIAELIIVDEENPLEGGVDIKARPKGKKFLTLKSMSGGEKTLTALSFIFALQEYQPAPFYIMDEVDAALDKENATRFGNLCKEYSDKAQFITISHNDNVISEADYLYGVSMNPDGVSKIVTLKLSD